MTKQILQTIKSIIALALVIFSLSFIIINNEEEKYIATVKEENALYSIIEVKKGSKIYENKENMQEEIKTDYINKNEVKLETKDSVSPENINDIDIKVSENNVIINFNEPEDKGKNYTYIINYKNKKQTLNISSKSGIFGYSYKISNNEKDVADMKVNKIDTSPITVQNIDFNKNYYLHIRTSDNNNNFSDNKTFKINLPSNGVNIQYVDVDNKTIANTEKISGMINEKYNVKNLAKKIDGYTFLETEGNLEGVLKKETINVKYKYSKKSP